MASVNTFNSPHRLTSKPEDLADGWSPRQLLRARRHIQTKPGRSLAPRLRSGVEGAQHRDAARQAAPHKSQSAAPGLACSPTPLSLWLPGRPRSSALSFGQCGKPSWEFPSLQNAENGLQRHLLMPFPALSVERQKEARDGRLADRRTAAKSCCCESSTFCKYAHKYGNFQGLIILVPIPEKQNEAANSRRRYLLFALNLYDRTTTSKRRQEAFGRCCCALALSSPSGS
ncbi:unnamed protein product [Amoebophrya sp. A120]|nr:unnamed protein product [Amoebophrya sp. A120]|eukprot:GSA120T00012046001.1